MKNISIEQIAEENPQLNLVCTTSQSSGYPSDIKYALIGFKSWSELQDLIKEYNLDWSPKYYMQKRGWNLWYRYGDALEPFDNEDIDDIEERYGEDCHVFDDSYDELSNILDAIKHYSNDNNFNKSLMNDCFDIDDVKKLFNEYKGDGIDVDKISNTIDNYKEVVDYYNDAQFDEVVIWDGYSYVDTIQSESMDANNGDGTYYIIGIDDLK